MKLFMFSFAAFMCGMCLQAQTIETKSSCDSNMDGEVTIADVTNTANKTLGKKTKEQEVVTAADLNALLKTINERLSTLESVNARLSAIEEKLGIETPDDVAEVEKGAGKLSFTVKGVTFNMKPVVGGTFTMGATSEQFDDYTPDSDESPTHQVTLSSFYMGETEVTQALWYAVMGATPSSSYSWDAASGLGDTYPAYYISWDECQAFISQLNTLTGKTFRMPTEAEWEYAARGGNKSNGYIFSGSDFIEDVAWYTSNSGSKTHPVATMDPNELGLYDMSGNVLECCSDWYGLYSSSAQTNPTGPASGTDRVFRGGSWYGSDTCCRVTYRNYNSPMYPDNYLGLRLALSRFNK